MCVTISPSGVLVFILYFFQNFQFLNWFFILNLKWSSWCESTSVCDNFTSWSPCHRLKVNFPPSLPKEFQNFGNSNIMEFKITIKWTFAVTVGVSGNLKINIHSTLKLWLFVHPFALPLICIMIHIHLIYSDENI